jgi:hypothetical protein
MGRAMGLSSRLPLLFVLLVSSLSAAVVGSAADDAGFDAGYSSTSGGGVTFRIFAHRLGLVGGTTANGHVIQENDRFATLPCFCALSSQGGDEFQVLIEYEGRSVIVPIWDVGPWNVSDNFWDPPEDREWKGLPRGLPQAQAAFYDDYNDGLDGWGRVVRTPAGMDIADGTYWFDLGMTNDDWVNVTFLWLEEEESEIDRLKRTVELPPPPEGYEDIPTVYPGERPPLDWVDPKDPERYFYITQTGHNIPAPIHAYWEANGGWRFFGLPISELFQQVRSDGTVSFVQLFERSILEFNPPPSEHPLVIGYLVGYSAHAPPEARAPVEPFESSNRSWYFPQTGHSLSNGFKDEWVSRGGLDVFGYPITEEFGAVSPDGRPYVAQIFERARFEWWPDRVGEKDEITYGLLVVELMQWEGFLP